MKNQIKLCTTVCKLLFESHLQYCTLIITKILEVLSLNVILDQTMSFFCHCALHITLSKKILEFRVLD